MKKQFTYEDCYNAAKQCEYSKEFKEKFPGEWGASCRHKTEDGIRWVDTFTWLKKGWSFRTYEDCYNAAKQCEYLKEFKEKFPKEYAASCQHKTEDGIRWVDTFDWLKRGWNTRTYESCRDAAMQCKSSKEFSDRFPIEYNASFRHKTEDGIRWVDTFTWLKKQTRISITTVINPFIENIDFWEALTIPEILGLASAFGSSSLMGKMLKKLAKSGPDSEERKFTMDSIKEMADMSEDEALEELKVEDDNVTETDMVEELVKAAENMPADEVEYHNELERIGKVMVGVEKLQGNKDIMNIINSGDIIKTLKDSITKRILLLSFEHPQVFDELTEKFSK